VVSGAFFFPNTITAASLVQLQKAYLTTLRGQKTGNVVGLGMPSFGPFVGHLDHHPKHPRLNPSWVLSFFTGDNHANHSNLGDAAALDPELRQLITDTFARVADCPEILGFVLVVEPGDTIAIIDASWGFPFLGRHEFIVEHAGYFELVYVLGQDGYGIECCIPKDRSPCLSCWRCVSSTHCRRSRCHESTASITTKATCVASMCHPRGGFFFNCDLFTQIIAPYMDRRNIAIDLPFNH
jgi:hypothetical protein